MKWVARACFVAAILAGVAFLSSERIPLTVGVSVPVFLGLGLVFHCLAERGKPFGTDTARRRTKRLGRLACGSGHLLVCDNWHLKREQIVDLPAGEYDVLGETLTDGADEVLVRLALRGTEVLRDDVEAACHDVPVDTGFIVLLDRSFAGQHVDTITLQKQVKGLLRAFGQQLCLRIPSGERQPLMAGLVVVAPGGDDIYRLTLSGRAGTVAEVHLGLGEP